MDGWIECVMCARMNVLINLLSAFVNSQFNNENEKLKTFWSESMMYVVVTKVSFGSFSSTQLVSFEPRISACTKLITFDSFEMSYRHRC